MPLSLPRRINYLLAISLLLLAVFAPDHGTHQATVDSGANSSQIASRRTLCSGSVPSGNPQQGQSLALTTGP